MNHHTEFSDRREAEFEASQRPASVSYLVRTIRSYTPVILISLLSVAVGYAVIAILLYLLSPAERTTMQPFRLEFRGATDGRLPNGVKFSATDIINTPVLLKVYDTDELKRFVKFGDFSRSIVVLESNREYEKLVADYQARLSDPRLSPPDRDRLQREFEAKRDSINKNDYALSYSRNSGSDLLPESLTRKVLVDILNTWANVAINEEHALDYRVAVLSPQILDQTEIGSSDPIVAIQILRSKIYRVIENIEDVNELPSAELMKTADHTSLAEIRLRLEDIVRFRLEPLMGIARASGLVSNPTQTIQFLENQLAYEQRRLQAAQARVEGMRVSLALYSNEQGGTVESVAAGSTPAGHTRPTTSAVENPGTIIPQVNENFLDRIVAMGRMATDAPYRQRMIEQYQREVRDTIPLEQAVAYQQQALDQIKNSSMSSALRSDEKSVRAEIDGVTTETRRLIVKVNEIYQLLSRNLNPSTQLFSLVGPPTTRIERARTLSRLALYGVLLLLVSLPIIVVLCLLHNRVREEEAAQLAAGASETA